MKNKIAKTLKSFVALWPETWSLPLAVTAFLASPYLLRTVDTTAGTYDTGILQAIVVTAIFLTSLNAMAFLGIRANFPVLFSYYKNISSIDFKKITPWQRLLVLLFIYAFFFTAGFLIVTALLK